MRKLKLPILLSSSLLVAVGSTYGLTWWLESLADSHPEYLEATQPIPSAKDGVPADLAALIER